MLKLNKIFSLSLIFVGLYGAAYPVEASFTETIKDGYNTLSNNIVQTWDEPQHYDLYVPAITWHARFAYDKEKNRRVQ